jgi:uncharacterized protein YndB with AHSA1/START domain
MNDTTTETERGEATFTRIYDAPAALVFECMTTPEHLTHFWAGPGMHTPLDKITVDLRIGGDFITTMVNDETGEEYPGVGVFVEIDPPTRLVFEEPIGDSPMRTSITFTDLGDGRCETVTHQTNVPAMFLTPEAQAGMRSSFDKFDAYLKTL